jgi:hypothetical protein
MMPLEKIAVLSRMFTCLYVIYIANTVLHFGLIVSLFMVVFVFFFVGLGFFFFNKKKT